MARAVYIYINNNFIAYYLNTNISNGTILKFFLPKIKKGESSHFVFFDGIPYFGSI